MRRIIAAVWFIYLGIGCAGDPGSDDTSAADAGETSDAGDVPDASNAPDASAIDAHAQDDARPTDAGSETSCVDVLDIVLSSSASYNGISGSPNPFAIQVNAIVTSPSGVVRQVEGFFDGDGAGGATGNVFKVRIYSDECGTWTWTSSSSEASLDGQSGALESTGLVGGVFTDGPIVIHPEHSRAFARAFTGEAVYLVGKFLDVAAPDPIEFSHTLLSEELSNTDRTNMVNRHANMQLNKMNIYLANRGDYGGVSTTPWVGSAGSNDKTRFSLSRWHMYEQWIGQLVNRGIVAHLWFFADDSGFGDLPDAARQRLIRYGMARLSAMPNTMFVLVLEWQEGWSPSEVNSHMSHLQQHNPWDRLASVHGTTGNFAFPTSLWADYMDIQSGNDASYSTVFAMGLNNRALATKPLINEEFGMGDENGAHRRKAWAAFMAGAAGSGTGGYLAHLVTFANGSGFERMAPANGLVTSGGAYALAETGEHYVLYIHNGGGVTLDLSAVAAETYDVVWYDPRTGNAIPSGTVTGGAPHLFAAPAGEDWILDLRRPAE